MEVKAWKDADFVFLRVPDPRERWFFMLWEGH